MLTRGRPSWWPVVGRTSPHAQARTLVSGPSPSTTRRRTASSHHRSPPPLPPPPAATRRDALAALAAAAPLPLLLLPGPPALAAAETRVRGTLDLAPALAASLEARVHSYTLSTGLRLLVVPRPEGGPVLSVQDHTDVGAWDEPAGQTGYAHMLEHMMFKGTPRTGNDGGASWKQERAALEAVDDAFEAVRAARRAAGLPVEGYSIGGGNGNGSGSGIKGNGNGNGGGGASSPASSALPSDVAKLEAELARLIADAAVFARQEDGYGARLQRAGAVGLNAATSHDETRYFCSLPANKLELWMALESERLAAPVFRQLHEEKRVVAEERRARLEASPRGKFTAAMAERAFLGGAAAPGAAGGANNTNSSSTNSSGNYGRPVLGYAEDVASVGRRELASFFRERYGPRAAVLAVVGDVSAATGVLEASRACDRVAAMAERYFGLWTGGAGGGGGGSAAAAVPLRDEALPRFLSSSSSSSGAAAEYIQRSPAGPVVYLAYPRPSLAASGAGGVALEAACDALSSGRSSRFGAAIIRPGKAIGATLVPGWPGDKHAGACLAAGVPLEGPAVDEAACRRLARLMQDQADGLAASGVTGAELARVKRGAAVGLLSATQSNAGLAGALAAYEATVPGGWRGLLEELGELEALTGEQVRAAAERTFDPRGRFVGLMLPEA